MNRKSIASAAAVLGLALVIPAAQAADFQYVTPEQKAMEAAKQGPEALRRFIQRTRTIYNLNFHDFYKPQE